MKNICIVWYALFVPLLAVAADFSGDYGAHHVGTLSINGAPTETIDRIDTFSIHTDGSVVGTSSEVTGSSGSVQADGAFNVLITNTRMSPSGQTILGKCTEVGKLVDSGGSVKGSGIYNCSYSDPKLAESGTWTAERLSAPPPTQPVPLPDPATLTIGNGIIPAENIALSSAGTIAQLTLVAELKIADIVAMPAAGFAAGGYKVYVVALVPGQQLARPQLLTVPFGKGGNGAWSEVAGPLPVFLENVAVSSQDSRVRIEILRDTNLSALVGTEFYLGYGTSDSEMIASRRYRGIFKVQ